MAPGVIQNIIFDWSGTLVDDLPAVLAATNFALAECGIEKMTLDRFRAEFCLPFKNFYDRFAPGVPVARLEESFHSHFGQVQDEVTELPHAREFLVFCRKHKIRTFLLSTVSRHYFDRQAAANGFDQFIDRPYLGVWDKRAKIAELLAENQLAPAQPFLLATCSMTLKPPNSGGLVPA